MNMLKRFWQEEEGLATVEIVVILAVLVSVALIFRTQIIEFVSNSLENLLGEADTEVVTGG